MLPGDVRKLADNLRGMTCERCSKPAEFEVCTESDSFGDETVLMCIDCKTAFVNQPPMEVECDWCKKLSEVHPLRDTLEEGSHGPVYYVCDDCKRKYRESEDAAFEEELSSMPPDELWL